MESFLEKQGFKSDKHNVNIGFLTKLNEVRRLAREGSLVSLLFKNFGTNESGIQYGHFDIIRRVVYRPNNQIDVLLRDSATVSIYSGTSFYAGVISFIFHK